MKPMLARLVRTLPDGGDGSARTPASFVAFDLPALGDESLLEVPFREPASCRIEQLDAAAPDVASVLGE